MDGLPNIVSKSQIQASILMVSGHSRSKMQFKQSREKVISISSQEVWYVAECQVSFLFLERGRKWSSSENIHCKKVPQVKNFSPSKALRLCKSEVPNSYNLHTPWAQIETKTWIRQPILNNLRWKKQKTDSWTAHQHQCYLEKLFRNPEN